jgi:hypothetical protein
MPSSQPFSSSVASDMFTGAQLPCGASRPREGRIKVETFTFTRYGLIHDAVLDANCDAVATTDSDDKGASLKRVSARLDRRGA